MSLKLKHVTFLKITICFLLSRPFGSTILDSNYIVKGCIFAGITTMSSMLAKFINLGEIFTIVGTSPHLNHLSEK